MSETTIVLSESVQAKLDALLALLAGYGRCAVAVSGGLDSAVAAKAAAVALGSGVFAVTAVSPSMAVRETEDARRVAQEIGIPHEEVRTDEVALPEYIENGPLRCYYCKRHIFTRLANFARERGVDIIVDGANADDLEDYRPGIEAARELGVRSPLAEVGLRKQELREVAAWWGLSVQDKAPSPCLASRVAYGVAITSERLKRIGRAEAFLAESGFSNFRVRLHGDDLARVEVSACSLARFVDLSFREAVVKTFRSLGFRYVTLDLEGFSSGSLNRLLMDSEPEAAGSHGAET